MVWKIGHKKTGGRAPGVPNKFTSIKQSFVSAFNDPRVGGEDGLVEWAIKNNENRRNFYQWITKLLPRTVEIESNSSLEDIILKWREVSNEDLLAKAKSIAREISGTSGDKPNSDQTPLSQSP